MNAEEPGADRFVDLQINGYLGVDFNDPSTSLDQLRKAAQGMLDHGVVVAFPTVITGQRSNMLRCLENLVCAIERDEQVAGIFRGIHVEGPFLSREPGFIGAHPAEHTSSQDLGLLDDLLEAGRGRIKLVTLAPEVDTGGRLTKHCAERGIAVAAGHTDATIDELACCVECGLSLFTHLGNGCPRLMDRHDNIIYRGLHFADQIHISVIADGFHVPRLLFTHILKCVPIRNLLVVSDAISAAGLGPGRYALGHRNVTVGEDGAARDASGEHFVGSASTLQHANHWLKEDMQLDEHRRRELLFDNPAKFIGLDPDRLSN